MSRIDVTVGVKNPAFRSGLEEVRGSARQFAEDIKGMFAGAFATGAIVAGISSVINKGDEIGDLATRFRISAEELQRLGMAAELSGTSMETVARSMNKLRLAQAGAVSGNEELAATFAGMGISVEQLAGMGTEELYYRVADAIAGAGGETQKLEIATALFGNRMAGELIPMLEQGGETMRALGGSAAVMSESTIASLSAAKDEITRLEQTFTVAFGAVVGAVIMPFIKAIQTLGAVLGGVFYAQTTVIGEFAGILAQALSGDFSGASARVRSFGAFFTDTMKAAAQATQDEIADIWTDTPTPSMPDTTAQHASVEATEKQKKAIEETAKLDKQLADEREKNARAAMDRQQRINSLQEEHNRLLAEAGLLTGNDKTTKPIEAERVKGELSRERRGAGEDEIRERERIEKEAERAAEQKKREEERRAEDLARAKGAESEVDERNNLAKMTPGQKRDYLAKKQKALLADAGKLSASGDELGATTKRTEAKRMQQEIDAAANETADGNGDARNVLTVDSLQRIGGGGNVGMVSDPAQREREKQTGLLERIARAVEDGGTQAPSAATMGE